MRNQINNDLGTGDKIQSGPWLAPRSPTARLSLPLARWPSLARRRSLASRSLAPRSPLARSPLARPSLAGLTLALARSLAPRSALAPPRSLSLALARSRSPLLALARLSLGRPNNKW